MLGHIDTSCRPRRCPDLALRAAPGQEIASAGSTGAGKTTITNLISRFYDAGDGKIRYGKATSSIDTRTERIVRAGMDALMAGCTTFVIAHRLSTVRNADCIMVMERGRIIERGSHDQLMERRGRYWQLYTGGSAPGWRLARGRMPSPAPRASPLVSLEVPPLASPS